MVLLLKNPKELKGRNTLEEIRAQWAGHKSEALTSVNIPSKKLFERETNYSTLRWLTA